MASDETAQSTVAPGSGEGEGEHASGDLRSEISRRIVHLHKETYGKGPAHTRTYLDRDMIVCTLGDALTRAERTLVDNGRDEIVMEQRAAWQEVMRPRFIAEVENATGRRVLAFMSANHLEPDVLAEIFLLEPEEAEAANGRPGAGG